MDKKKDELMQLLKRFKNEAGKIAKIDKFILFGSRAKGAQTSLSDVDILIISKDFKGKKSFRRSPDFYLLWNHDLNIDIICLTPEELKEKKKEIGVVSEAIKYGVEI